MKTFKKILIHGILPLLIIINLSGCDVLSFLNGDNNTSENASTETSTTTNTTSTTSNETSSGTIKASDGSPLAGVTVAISSTSSANLIKAAIKDQSGRIGVLPKMLDQDGDECADISEISGEIYAYDCTDASGTYSLTGEIPCGSAVTFHAIKGSFSMSFSINFTCPENESGDGKIQVSYMDDFVFDNNCGVPAEEEAERSECAIICHLPPGNPENEHNICISQSAIETHLDHGDYLGECGVDYNEALQNNQIKTPTLIKPKPSYSVDHNSCQFDIANMAVVTGDYDEMENVLAKLGYGSIASWGSLDKSQPFDFTLIDGDDTLNDTQFDNFEDFVANVDNLAPYDIIFINCGSVFEELSTDPQVQANLKEYVENGGKLYVTDWSYMFIEQSFPDFMDFLLGGNTSTEPETPYDAAKVGEGGITTRAHVNDDTMASWLDGVTVNPGTPDYDCYYFDETNRNSKLGARNSDGTITIGDFLSSWVVMIGEHDGGDHLTKSWINGPISFYYGEDSNAPLTVTKDIGAGRILYSSYHTAHSCPTTGFWPQERILQYLVFEL